MSSLKRYPRSFGEDPDYSPAWRASQASEYYRVFKERIQDGEENVVVLPEDEDDEYVIDYFSFLVYGTSRFPEIKYANSCFRSNPNKGFGTQIQSMFLGKKTIPDIAQGFKTSPKNIECYLKLFFDVSDYLDCENFIYSVISPYDKWKETPKEDLAASIWMGLSYEFGWDVAKYILQRRLHITEDISKRLSSAMAQSLELQASEYVLGVRLAVSARPSDFDRHVQYTNAMSLSEANKKDDGTFGGEFFRQALWASIKEASVSLVEDDPVRTMISDLDFENRTEKKSKRELIYFSPQPI